MKKISATRELQDLLSSSEQLLDSLGDASGAAAAPLRARLAKTISDARERLNESMETGEATAAEVVGGIRDFVSERPWTAALLGTSLAIAVGALMMGVAGPRRRW